MRVLIIAAAEGGCKHYRIDLPVQALRDKLDIEVREPVVGYDKDPSKYADATVMAVETLDVDLVVIQRPTRRQTYEAMLGIQEQGIPVCVELDDAFHWLSKRNKVSKLINSRRLSPHENNWWLQKAVDSADAISVTTPGLARLYGADKAYVLPNYVSERLLGITAEPLPGPVTITWSGTVETHPDDLPMTGGAVARVIEATGAQLFIVGPPDMVAEQLKLRDISYSGSGWCSLHRYPLELAKADVGIVPLQDNRFNRYGKSALKMMEFAALGVPPIVSPTEDNLRMWAHGIGILARNPGEWETYLTRLVTDDLYRKGMSESGRAIMQDYTIEKNAWRWAEAWAAIVDKHRGVSA